MSEESGEKKTIRLADLKAKQIGTARVVNGRYAIGPKPIQGGISEVYRAVDLVQGNREVALKLFGLGGMPDEVLQESYRRELQALGDLRHPNIVELLDHGCDAESGRNFLVLEWLEHDLSEMRDQFSGAAWNHFYEDIGRKVLQALAFAHSRGCVHRDIKPSNILISKSRIPKLADFGISKIKRLLSPGITLAQYATAPYAPPEYDDGSSSYSRDVFAFGVVSLVCLSTRSIEKHEDLPSAISDSRLPKDVRDLFERMLCLDNQSIRPQNAAVLLSLLDQISVRDKKISPTSRIWISLTQRAIQHITVEFGFSSEAEVTEFVNKDIEHARVRPDSQQNPSGAAQSPTEEMYLLIGTSLSYRIVVDPKSGIASARVVSAVKLNPSTIDEMREDSFESPSSFVCGSSPVATVSSNAVLDLVSRISEWDQDRKVRLQKKRESFIYQKWLSLLLAKTELEQNKRTPLEYEAVSIKGKLAEFTLTKKVSEEELLGQSRKVDLGEKKFLCGDVQDVSGNQVTIFITKFNAEVDEVPEEGELVLDTFAAEVAIQRQRIALDVVRHGRSINPSLGDQIVNPSRVAEPQSVATTFIQSNLDESKQKAVRAALGMGDLLAIEGPPGTGKTTFITEVILQLLRRDPKCRILLTSQTNVALDNAIEKIQMATVAPVRMVRIGSEDETKVSAAIRPLLIPHQLRKWREEALKKGKIFVDRWAASNGISKKDVEIAILLERLAAAKRTFEDLESQRENIEKRLEKPKSDTVTDGEPLDLGAELAEIQRHERDIKREVHTLGDSLKKLEKTQSVSELLAMSADELDEWARAYFPDTPEASRLRKLLQIHADWEIRFGRGSEFNAALLVSAQVVAGTCVGFLSVKGIQDVDFDYCIVDEASVATPTEALIPMSRSRKAILVGDKYQLSPFQDPDLRNQGLLKKFNLSEDDQKQTLFNQMLSGLPESSRPSLSIQYRMVDPIGNMVSQCFYRGSLTSRRPTLDEDLLITFGKPVRWFSTSQIATRFERKIGGSFANPCETEITTALLGRVNFFASKKKRKYSVAVLTGYNGQKRAFENAFASEKPKWSAISELQVNTVDAFQGREADIVIFSVTRSSQAGTLGFLKEFERINVALSRGKFYLGIVGDHVFCRTVMGLNPLRVVIDYIEGNPDGCLIQEESP